MGLFDVFSKGGKYFGKAIEPRCEYCEFGKRATDGNKVLCAKKGMVDAGFHCPKFTYSPLKRIPVKQMNMVGWLEGDYDEKNFDEEPEKSAAKSSGDAKAKKSVEPAKESVPVESAKEPVTVAAAAPAPITAHTAANDLAALAAAVEAVGAYVPEAEPSETEEAPAADTPTLDSL